MSSICYSMRINFNIACIECKLDYWLLLNTSHLRLLTVIVKLSCCCCCSFFSSDCRFESRYIGNSAQFFGVLNVKLAGNFQLAVICGNRGLHSLSLVYDFVFLLSTWLWRIFLCKMTQGSRLLQMSWRCHNDIDRSVRTCFDILWKIESERVSFNSVWITPRNKYVNFCWYSIFIVSFWLFSYVLICMCLCLCLSPSPFHSVAIGLWKIQSTAMRMSRAKQHTHTQLSAQTHVHSQAGQQWSNSNSSDKTNACTTQCFTFNFNCSTITQHRCDTDANVNSCKCYTEIGSKNIH